METGAAFSVGVPSARPAAHPAPVIPSSKAAQWRSSSPADRLPTKYRRRVFVASLPVAPKDARAQLDVDVAQARPAVDRVQIHREVFEEISREEEMSLARVAALIEQNATGVPASETLAALDSLAEGAREHAPESPYPLRVLRAARGYLFEELGFRTSREHRSPAAAYLSYALAARSGYTGPLTLLYAAVCERMGLACDVAAFPGPFLLRPRARDGEEGPEVLVDAAKGGALLYRDDCLARFRTLTRDPAAALPDPMLRGEPRRRTLFRVLRGLKSVHLSRCELEGALAAAELLALVDPLNVCERRDLALLRFALGRDLEAARTDLLMYAGQCSRLAPGGRERALVMEAADRIGALERGLASEGDPEARLQLVQMLAPHPARLARTIASLAWADYSGPALDA
eukprot:tig00000241_g21067.t1